MEFDYPCKLNKIIDNDKVELFIDQGFYSWRQEYIGLWGVESSDPRKRTDEEKEQVDKAKDFIQDWFTRYSVQGIRVTIGMSKTKKDTEKYGQWIGYIYYKDKITGRQKCLSDELVYRDLVEPRLEPGFYHGKTKEQIAAEKKAENDLHLDTPEDS